MPKTRNSYEKLAIDAEARITRARDRGEQLTFLADELPARPGQRDPDAPKRGKGKAMSQMREWLKSRGFRLPEEVLAELGGLTTGETVLQGAMRETEEILLWAQDGAAREGKDQKKAKPSMHQRLTTLQQVLAVRLRAADALMPYGAAKVTADVSVRQSTTIVMPGATGRPAGPGQPMRDVTPGSARPMSPPPLPSETKQNQPLSETNPNNPDAESRTE